MALVFAGICGHGPGITQRAAQADPAQLAELHRYYGLMRQALEASRPDALVVITGEHFANFFMNNMPAFAVGMADYYHGPIEDEDWLKIRKVKVPGSKDLSSRLITSIMHDVDVAYAEEWQFDHGIMVPLHFLTPDYRLPVIPVNINCQGPPLTPLHRAWKFGEALRHACDSVPERVAVVGAGGISHWPCTPDAEKVNELWDREFLRRWAANDRATLLSYTDEETYRDAGQGGFEIRNFIAVAAVAGGRGKVWYYRPMPIFSIGCSIGVMSLSPAVEPPEAPNGNAP
jgi:aromatic ring-opening dioxygenase catalytic subunit (LigB family)